MIHFALANIFCYMALQAITPLHMQQIAQPKECPSKTIRPISVKKPVKYLHISFHRGCILDIEQVAKELSLDVTSWYIFDYPLEHLEGINSDLYVYNITRERAERIWQKHKDYFNQFDAIITSDTAPLSRIFLQDDHWKKPLIIWVCNRFDYFYSPNHKPIDFPDAEYYELFKRATTQELVQIIPYTAYEWYHGLLKGIAFKLNTIKPLGIAPEGLRYTSNQWSIPQGVNKAETFYITPRLNAEQLDYVQRSCNDHGIPTYAGRYNGPHDLEGFKGVICFPYQWSTLALFENMHHGLIHFVPSPKFLHELKHKKIPLHSVMECMLKDRSFSLNEYYSPEHAPYMVYFDSWQDLKEKIATIDYTAMRQQILAFAQQHTSTTLQAWQEVFATVAQQVAANIN